MRRELLGSPAFLRSAFFLSLYLFTNCGTHAAAEDEAKTQQILVLHSYLLPPSWAHRVREESQSSGKVEVRFVLADSLTASDLEEKLNGVDLVLMDVAHESVFDTVAQRFLATIRQVEQPYVLVSDFESVQEGQELSIGQDVGHAGVPAEWADRVRKYYRYGGTTNLQLLIRAFSQDPTPFAEADYPVPALIPERGFYHPDWPQIESELSVVKEKLAAKNQPVAAIAINRATVSACNTGWLVALMKALEDRGLSSYAFFGPRQDANRFTRMTCVETEGELKPLSDLIINSVLVFRPQERKQELEKIGVPVLQTLPARSRSVEQWQASNDGLALADISYYYSSSELAGMVDPILVSAQNPEKQSLDPIASQIAGIADRAAALIRLKESNRSERRIAIFVYNYPPGGNNFGASFLNVPKSLEKTLKAMRDQGYSTETPDAESLTSQLQICMQGLYDRDGLEQLPESRSSAAAIVSLEDYKEWFQEVPEETRKRIVAYWGSPESMSVSLGENGERGFMIPRVSLGNILVMPQPLRYELTRSTAADVRKKRISHKSSVPLSHNYLASYLLVKQEFGAHAVIHFGTHGTQEWAPGKQRALAMQDEAMLAIGDLPNFYPYIMDNLGEATTAKRRGRATMIGHLTPMFSPSGFRPGLHDMHVLMHDWETVSAGPVKRELERQLVEEFVKHKLDKDLSWTSEEIEEGFEFFIEELHPYLDDIAQSAQPQGLAVFGEIPSEERRFGMVMQMLRKRLIDSLGEDIDEVFLIDADQVTNSRPARWLRLALSNAEAASQLDLREIDRLDISNQNSVPNRAEEKKLDQQELLDLAKEAQRLEQLLAQNPEINALLGALNGTHVGSGYGGDPVRNPDSLPTGRNLYGFDPVRVPTAPSWKIGVGVLDKWIAQYRSQHDGVYPKQLAFTLWAGETMRHHGIMESQIFYALGVEPQWDASGRMKGFDIIPADELSRPRIDVLANVTGSYRDQFPQLMQWIDKAVVAVAELELPSTAEEQGDTASSAYSNYVAQHIQQLRDELITQGWDAKLAGRWASARVFSNESGAYGTGLNNAVYHSDLWDSQERGGGDAEMSELFLDRMGHAYGEGLDGVAAAELFTKHVQNLNAVFLARSSNTYGVLTSDDPFAYLGGFSLASRVAGSKSPELIVQNLRDPSEVILDPADRAIAKEMQTRYLHPQWIRTQQQEGYSGTLQVLKATEFLWGWQTIAPETVREDQWQSLMEVYLEDQYELGAREWLEQSNHQALAQIAERMLEAVRLNYWNPSSEDQQKLAKIYIAARDASGLRELNPKVVTFVSGLLRDLDAKEIASESVASNSDSPASEEADAIDNDAEPLSRGSEVAEVERIRGLELRPADTPASEMPNQAEAPNHFITHPIAAMLVLILSGAIARIVRSANRKA